EGVEPRLELGDALLQLGLLIFEDRLPSSLLGLLVEQQVGSPSSPGLLLFAPSLGPLLIGLARGGVGFVGHGVSRILFRVWMAICECSRTFPVRQAIRRARFSGLMKLPTF